MKPWNYHGNDWAVDLLKKHILADTVRHANLISGPNGIGRRTLAIRLCQAIFCEALVEGEPCFTCRSCVTLEQGKHFDLKVISRLPSKKDILVEQVREAEAFLRLTPYGNKKKVVIFSEFDLANQEAQNALLKTLEEAPSYAVLIILVENPLSLLPTVVSRCEIIDLRPLVRQEVVEFLQERKAPPANLELVATLAEGKPGYAYNLAFDAGDELKNRQEWINDLFTLLPQPLPTQFYYIEKLAEKDKRARDSAKVKAKKMSAKRSVKLTEVEEQLDAEVGLEEGLIERLLLTWLGVFRDAYIRKIRSAAPITNLDFSAQIDGLVGTWSEDKILAFIVALETALTQCKANVTKRLALEAMFLKL